MELQFCTKLLTLRGISISSCKIGKISPYSPTRKRYKHQDLVNHAKLSTQSNTMRERDGEQKLYCDRRPHVVPYKNAEIFRNKVAMSTSVGDYLYEDVYMRSWDLAKGINDMLGEGPRKRICLLCPGDVTHVISMWSCWMTGHVAVPLCPSRSQERLETIIQDSNCDLVIATADQINRVHTITKKLGQKLIVLDDTWWSEPKTETENGDTSPLPRPFCDDDIIRDKNAMILYTSGMTGRPRGILYTHQVLQHQIESVISSWNLVTEDSVLHSLPLDTLYGCINSLQAPLSSGAKIINVPVNDDVKIWSHMLGVGVKTGKPLTKIHNVTIFPSTPPTYKSLADSYAELFKDKKTKEYVKSACTKRLRHMISSTSALPISLSAQWKNISGHKILDTFTSTESGTGLESRETQLVKFWDHTKASHDVLTYNHESLINNNLDTDEPVIGELRMKLNSEDISTKYIETDTNEETRVTCDDQWFYTGDLVEFSEGSHKLWGKLNIYDIKIEESLVNTASVEKLLLSNKDIDDCYVIGLGDVEGEQQIAAIICLTQTRKVSLDSILNWCGENMSKHQIPTTFKIVPAISRDKFGQIDKPKLRTQFHKEAILCFHDSKL